MFCFHRVEVFEVVEIESEHRAVLLSFISDRLDDSQVDRPPGRPPCGQEGNQENNRQRNQNNPGWKCEWNRVSADHRRRRPCQKISIKNPAITAVIKPITPITTASSRIILRNCPRSPPIARITPNSRLRSAVEIINALMI